MDDKVQTALDEAILGLIDNVTAAADFVVDEIPAVIQQLLAWNMAQSILTNLISLAALVSVFYVIRKLTRDWAAHEKSNKTYASGTLIGYTIGGSAYSICVAPFALTAFNLVWLQIWIAPKVYLIEYAATLVK